MIAVDPRQMCFYHARALVRLRSEGPNSPDETERKSLRDCVLGCNGLVSSSGPNRHNGHGNPNNPPSEGALLNFCNGYVSLGDVEIGKCVGRVKAEGLIKRNEPIDGYSDCAKCTQFDSENHQPCYENIKDYIHVEEIFRGYHGVRGLRL